MLVLVLNCGSSSVKLSLLDAESGQSLAEGLVDRVGDTEAAGTARLHGPGLSPCCESLAARGYEEAIRWLVDRLPAGKRPAAVGHRVVHGGERYTTSVRVDAAVLQELEAVSRLAPLHNPPNLQGIHAAQALFPDLPQVVAFDTAFHATLSDFAYRFALPDRFYHQHGIRRYGFHGLSHRYVSERAAALLQRSDLRLVSLHLGNGCSAAAVRGGRCVDTSMGMTPLAGLVMGTRCGDLDPAVPLLLAGLEGESLAHVERVLNRESGMKALSGGHADMRDIEAAAAQGDEKAQLAFRVFCYTARKYVGAYAAALGGLDALVFTAGIGENSARVRAEICAGLEFLGVRLDPQRNGEDSDQARDLSIPNAAVRVLAIPTDEELVIARETAAVLQLES